MYVFVGNIHLKEQQKERTERNKTEQHQASSPALHRLMPQGAAAAISKTSYYAASYQMKDGDSR